jgi:hypothetical protein
MKLRNTDKFALFFTALYVVIALILCIAVVRADDHMIRPTCWEENHNGTVERHCEVKRDDAPKPAQPPARRPLYDADQPVPPPAAAPPYPGYQTTLPPRYWPGVPQQGRNWANPCTPYVCGYGSPYGYGYPPPYYYGPPGIGFQFGPFSVWVP